MKRIHKVLALTLGLALIILGPGLVYNSGAKSGSVQKLVGAGSFGKRPPMLIGDFSIYLVNPNSSGNIIIDKIRVVREDTVAILELTPGQFETPKGKDNILEPCESWEFVTSKFVDLPPDKKLTYSAEVYWHANNNNQLIGWWYQKILLGPEGKLPQLALTQVPMVNIVE